MSPRRRWVLRGMAVLLGLGLLGLLELGARWVEPVVAPPPSGDWDRGFATVGSEERVTTFEPVPQRPGWLQTPRSMVDAGLMLDLTFPALPDPAVPRVACLGGSTTLGLPFLDQPERSFPRRLAAHLEQRGRPSEVLNLGGASFASGQVLELVEQLVSQGASILVVYSANNEVFDHNLRLFEDAGPQGGLPYRSALVRVLTRWLRPTEPAALEVRQLAAAQRAVITPLLRGDSVPPVLGPHGFAERADRHHQAVIERYQAKLEALVELAAAAEPPVAVILVEPPRNLLEPPWLSLHHPDLVGAELSAWEQRWSEARRASLAGAWPEALVAYDELVRDDDRFAEVRFERGLVQLELGQREAGVADLAAALELDMDAGRPLAGQLRILRALGARPGVDVVSIADLAPDGLDPQHTVFHDACHLTAAGYDELARRLAVEIVP